ncbi:MAG: hypothetical protein JXA42_08365 [Anaerolineales bacterium]|nr:hypothetical protein [Anaerolineales bacterium]
MVSDIPDRPKPSNIYRLTSSLSKNASNLQVGESAIFRIQAWMTKAGGGWAPANLVPIEIQTDPGLKLEPDGGVGSLTCHIHALKPGLYSLAVTGATPSGPIETLAAVNVLPSPLVMSVTPPQLSVDVGGQQQITIKVEREVFEGRQAESEAVIELELPPEITSCDNQKAGDIQAQGSLTTTLQIKEDAAPGKYKVVATGLVGKEKVWEEIDVEILPIQVWRFYFEKAMWQAQEGIDLDGLGEIPHEAWRSLGLEGGKLVVKPRGFTHTGYDEKNIETSQIIRGAPVCRLDHGSKGTIDGVWNDSIDGYLFSISPISAKSAPGNQKIVVEIPVPFHEKWGDQIRYLLETARELGRELPEGLPERAETFAGRFLDQFARLSEFNLYANREQLRTRLLNASNFLAFILSGLSLFERSLTLYSNAFDQLKNSLIDLDIEITFLLFDLFTQVRTASQTAKQALAGITGKAIKEAVDQSVRQLAKEAAEQQAQVAAARQARTQSLDSLQEAESMLDKFPKGTPHYTKQLKLLGELLTQDQSVYCQILNKEAQLAFIKQTQTFYVEHIQANADRLNSEEFLKSVQELAGDVAQKLDVENLLQDTAEEQARLLSRMQALRAEIQSTIKGLGKDSDETAELESLKSEVENQIDRIEQQGLWSLESYTDLLARQPLGELAQKVRKATAQAEKEAEKIHPPNTEWENYKDWLSIDRLAADGNVEKITWLDEMIREFIPAIISLERWLSYTVDTVSSYLPQITTAAVEFTNSRFWRRTSIAMEYREKGRQTALNKGKIGAEFFAFPQTAGNLIRQCNPRNLISIGQNGSEEEKNRIKEAIRSGVEDDYRRETALQKKRAITFFEILCFEALNPDTLKQSDESQLVDLHELNQIWRQLAQTLTAFEKALQTGGKTGTDRLWSIGQFVPNSTYQDWDGAIEWLAWGVAWSYRLGSLAAQYSEYGELAASKYFTDNQGVKWVGTQVRQIAAALGALPDIIGFQFDLIVVAAVARDAMQTGNTDIRYPDIQSLVVDGYTPE